MEIVEMRLSELKPDPDNAKTHTQEQVQRLAAAIEKYGFNNPIGIWGDNNLIAAGEGRWRALKLLGWETVPCIRLDHLTDEQRQEYALLDNKLNMETPFDVVKVKKTLRSLKGFDGKKFGFSFDFSGEAAKPEPSRFVKSFEEGKGKEDFFALGGGDALPAPSSFPIAFTLDEEEFSRCVAVKEKHRINYKDIFLKGVGAL